MPSRKQRNARPPLILLDVTLAIRVVDLPEPTVAEHVTLCRYTGL
jgi:hypothetical protein